MPDTARLPFHVPFGLLLLGACSSTTSKQAHLENVAKDWCLAIRASQVMPVYPLTQDLQPGDVFLVRLPIDRQQLAFKERGYLPLDNHVARLDPDGYAAFYRKSFPVPATAPDLPLAYLQAAPPWTTAPHAGFPTYSFSVSRGGSLQLAIPVSGVPVGLSLLGTDAAEGTISIGKARTLGVDTVSLDRQLRGWAEQADNRRFLAGLASTSTQKNYLRIVTRVYLTGELDVSLRSSAQRAGGVAAGFEGVAAALVPQAPVSGSDTSQTNATNYSAAIDALNRQLAGQDRAPAGATPGGSLRIVAASARTISLREDFDPPLVIGYLGFDCEIGRGGVLGPAVPTYALASGQLGGEAFLAATPTGKAYLDQWWLAAYQIAESRQNDDASARRVVEMCDGLARFVPPVFEVYERQIDNELIESSRSVPLERPRTYATFRQWQANLASSIRNLTGALAMPSFALLRNGASEEVEPGSTEARQLAGRLAALRAQRDNESVALEHAAARRALADWLFAHLYAEDRSTTDPK